MLVEGEAELGSEIAVTGQVPASVDFSELLSSRTPYFFVAVLLVSFLLMMWVFRSLLVPLKAVIMNLLSIGAAYGITVAVVQWGWLGDVTGLAPGPIETFAPMMFFAIVFGLSMDYEVFLLSRIKEEYNRTGDSHTSVANGLATTARVISAAAAIMVFVFGSFILENDRTFKLFGVGLASAIFLDATVVRMLLVPATMELLGDRNWWLPALARPDPPGDQHRGHPRPVVRHRRRARARPRAGHRLTRPARMTACSRSPATRSSTSSSTSGCPRSSEPRPRSHALTCRPWHASNRRRSAGMGEHVDWSLHRTKMAVGMGQLSEAVYGNTQLALREREAARWTIALINDCVVCQGTRAKDAEAHWVDEAFYAEVADWRTSTELSERERLAAEFAQRFALDHRRWTTTSGRASRRTTPTTRSPTS